MIKNIQGLLFLFTVLIFSFTVYTLVSARIGDPPRDTGAAGAEIISVKPTYQPAYSSAYYMTYFRVAPAQDKKETNPEVQVMGRDSELASELAETDSEPRQGALPAKEQKKELPVQESGNPTEIHDLNKYVLSIIETYEIGQYPYLLNTDYKNYNGVTMDLYYKGRIMAKAHPSSNRASHCVGITFEVFTRAMRERNRSLDISEDNFNGMAWEELRDFMLTWYVASGSKTSNNLAAAVEKYGVGRRITDFEEAKPGDFIDFSRENGTGHAAVFLDWVRENDKIIGLKYWSSQPSTKGINYNVEYFNVKRSNNTKYGNVRTDNVYIASIFTVDEYR